jgi:murein DD-endopeptidase MepM/ murein hydrolase activator NlpD
MPSAPMLAVEQPDGTEQLGPFLGSVGHIRRPDGSGQIWRSEFATTLERVQDPEARYTLLLEGLAPISLPIPTPHPSVEVAGVEQTPVGLPSLELTGLDLSEQLALQRSPWRTKCRVAVGVAPVVAVSAQMWLSSSVAPAAPLTGCPRVATPATPLSVIERCKLAPPPPVSPPKPAAAATPPPAPKKPAVAAKPKPAVDHVSVAKVMVVRHLDKQRKLDVHIPPRHPSSATSTIPTPLPHQTTTTTATPHHHIAPHHHGKGNGKGKGHGKGHGNGHHHGSSPVDLLQVTGHLSPNPSWSPGGKHHRRGVDLNLRAAGVKHTGGAGLTAARTIRPLTGGITASFGPAPGQIDTGLLLSISGLYGSAPGPPAWLVPIYKEAGSRYHIPWQILAAINWIETDYGSNLSTSPAGAMGWMQFMPGTWQTYAVDASHTGHPNPYDPRDAIFSAAHYLAANGGAQDIRRAVFAYNHATWYVDAVLARAATLGTPTGLKLSAKGYGLPLDPQYMTQLGRTDDGVDIELAPDGAAVFSMTAGLVTAVASNPGGFGPNYPVIQTTKGPLSGRCIYYGHVAAALVRPGQHVAAGQPIAIMGHTGDAASLGHGHIEIGFSDCAGDPLSHHGAEAWTPSGQAMRDMIVTLSTAYGIHNS